MNHLCRKLLSIYAVVAAVGCTGPARLPLQASTGASAGAASTLASPGTVQAPTVAASAGSAAVAPPLVAGHTAGRPAAAGSVGSPQAAAVGGAGAGAGAAAGAGASAGAAGGGGRSVEAGSAAMPAASGAAAAPSGDAQSLPAITDYAAQGPFETVVEPNSGPDGNFTIYRPEPLGADGFLHSPIVFGPGIATSCAPNGALNIYTELLNHFSSHGYVTICANSLTGGPNAPGNLSAMKTGLEWIVAQNEQSGVFQGKLAVKRAAAMGYSIGATASTQLSSHAAIMTTVSIHGHNTTGDPHGPIWLVTGTMDVIDDNRTTLSTLTEAPAVLSALPIGHLDVVGELGRTGRYIAPLTAWLRYWVNDDQGAKRFILGDSCETCKSPWIAPESNDLWKAQP